MSTAAVEQDERATLATLVERARTKLEPFVGKDPAAMERLTQILVFEGKRAPALLKCSGLSIISAVVTIYRWGLDLGEDAFIVPYKGVATPVAHYKGLVRLIIQSKVVRWVKAEPVYENDFLEYWLGMNATLRHRPAEDEDNRGALKGAYVIFRLPFSQEEFCYMSIREIEKIRKDSKQWGPDKVKDCPWWYACKTAIRRGAKLLPKSRAWEQVVDVLSAEEREEQAQADALTMGASPVALVETAVPKQLTEAMPDVAPPPVVRVPAELLPRTTAPDVKRLAYAHDKPLMGNHSTWDGHGGKPIGTVPSTSLAAARQFFHKKDGELRDPLSPAESIHRNNLRAQIQAIDLVLADRAKEQGSLGFDDAHVARVLADEPDTLPFD